MAPINFIFTITVMIFVSLITAPPPVEKIKDNTLTRQFFRDEKTYFKGMPFYKDFRIWALVLVLFCFVMFAIYW